MDLFISKLGNIVGNIVGLLFVLLKLDINLIVCLLIFCRSFVVIDERWVFV